MTEGAGEARADVSLFDAKAGVRIAASPELLTMGKPKFARGLYKIIYPAVARRQATVLSALEQDLVSARLWRAAADEAPSGLTTPDTPAMVEYRAALALSPHEPVALIGLARGLLYKVARDQSKGDGRTKDLDEAAALLTQAKGRTDYLAQVAFLQGVLAKLRFNYEEAIEDFERTRNLDPYNLEAAAQAAHVKLFLGRFEQAYAEMEAVQDIAAANSEFIAGETALLSGHLDRALTYFDMAVTASPEVARNHAWRAVALLRAGRKEDAAEAAEKSQQGHPPYRPDWMAARSQFANPDAPKPRATIFVETLKRLYAGRTIEKPEVFLSSRG